MNNMEKITTLTTDNMLKDIEQMQQYLNYFKELLTKCRADLPKVEKAVYDRYNTMPVKEEDTDKKAVIHTISGERVVPVALAERQQLKGQKDQTAETVEEYKERLNDSIDWGKFDLKDFAMKYSQSKKIDIKDIKNLLTRFGFVKVSDITDPKEVRAFHDALIELGRKQDEQNAKPF